MSKLYKTKCPVCDTAINTEKSLFHSIGLFTAGYKICPKCKVQIQIKYDPIKDTMTAYNYNGTFN